MRLDPSFKTPRPTKRSKLVDELLNRDEYADFWSNKWADLLRPNPYRVGIKATLSLDTWIRNAFRQNLPYDQFVRNLPDGSREQLAQRSSHSVSRSTGTGRNSDNYESVISRRAARMRKMPSTSVRSLWSKKISMG